MPFARLTLTGPVLLPAARDALAAAVAALVDETLDKDPARTAVLVEEVTGSAWLAGGPVARLAHLEVIVTAGTNTPAQERAFVSGAHALMRGLPGGVAEVTYAVVRERPAAAWGFGGITQADRKAARGSSGPTP